MKTKNLAFPRRHTIHCTVYSMYSTRSEAIQTIEKVPLSHRRRMEIESKAKCCRFGMGGKIKCCTGNFWCECVANVYIAVVHFPFTFVGGGSFM